MVLHLAVNARRTVAESRVLRAAAQATNSG